MKKTGTAIRPISDHIVVKREDAEATTPGGIVLPDAAKNKPTRGKVIAVGCGQLLPSGVRAEMQVAEGDTVVFGAYDGSEVDIEGEKFVIIREGDVLLVM